MIWHCTPIHISTLHSRKTHIHRRKHIHTAVHHTQTTQQRYTSREIETGATKSMAHRTSGTASKPDPMFSESEKLVQLSLLCMSKDWNGTMRNKELVQRDPHHLESKGHWWTQTKGILYLRVTNLSPPDTQQIPSCLDQAQTSSLPVTLSSMDGRNSISPSLSWCQFCRFRASSINTAAAAQTAEPHNWRQQQTAKYRQPALKSKSSPP